MRKSKTIILLVIMLTNQAYAAPWRGGIGVKQCSDLNSELATQPDIAKAKYLNWTQGYFSGENNMLMLHKEVYHVVPNDEIVWDRVINICRGAPVKTISQMAADYFASLHERALTH